MSRTTLYAAPVVCQSQFETSFLQVDLVSCFDSTDRACVLLCHLPSVEHAGVAPGLESQPALLHGRFLCRFLCPLCCFVLSCCQSEFYAGHVSYFDGIEISATSLCTMSCSVLLTGDRESNSACTSAPYICPTSGADLSIRYVTVYCDVYFCHGRSWFVMFS